MTITREQIADLRKGDVVTLTSTDWPEHTAITGALVETSDGRLMITLPHGLVSYVVRDLNGYPMYGHQRSLTVVKKASRPFYANSDQTEPELGDIAQSPNGEIHWAAKDRDGHLRWWRYNKQQRRQLYVDTIATNRGGQPILLGKAAD